MLLDGNGLIYRGYFALPPLTTSKGELVNAVFGFCSIVLRGIQDLQPDYVAVAFDLQGPTFRHEQYAEYKATRQRMPDDLRDQFPKVREVVKALRIPVYELAGYEADDVIGTLTVEAEAPRSRHDDRDRRPRHAPARHRPHAADDDAVRRREHDHLRPGPDRRAVRPAARPDDRLQGAQGRPDRQHPGRARGGGEDRGQARSASSGRSRRSTSGSTRSSRTSCARSSSSIATRCSWARTCRRSSATCPVAFDLEAARLGDYDRETVIRLFREYEFRTLIERLPAMTGETAGAAAETLRGVATDGSVPAARVGRRCAAVGLGVGSAGPAAVRGRRAAAVARLRLRLAAGGRRRAPRRHPATAAT